MCSTPFPRFPQLDYSSVTGVTTCFIPHVKLTLSLPCSHFLTLLLVFPEIDHHQRVSSDCTKLWWLVCLETQGCQLTWLKITDLCPFFWVQILWLLYLSSLLLFLKNTKHFYHSHSFLWTCYFFCPYLVPSLKSSYWAQIPNPPPVKPSMTSFCTDMLPQHVLHLSP